MTFFRHVPTGEDPWEDPGHTGDMMSHGVWGTPLFPTGAWGEGGLRVPASAAVAMNPWMDRWMDGWCFLELHKCTFFKSQILARKDKTPKSWEAFNRLRASYLLFLHNS